MLSITIGRGGFNTGFVAPGDGVSWIQANHVLKHFVKVENRLSLGKYIFCFLVIINPYYRKQLSDIVTLASANSKRFFRNVLVGNAQLNDVSKSVVMFVKG